MVDSLKDRFAAQPKNFFYLGDAETTARLLCDVHVTNMVDEYALVLCSALQHWGMLDKVTVAYEPCRMHDPVVLWCAASSWHFKLVLEHAMELGCEFERRFKRSHLSSAVIGDIMLSVGLDLTFDKMPPSPAELLAFIGHRAGETCARNVQKKLATIRAPWGKRSALPQRLTGILAFGAHVSEPDTAKAEDIVQRLLRHLRSEDAETAYRDYYATKILLGFRKQHGAGLGYKRSGLTWRGTSQIPKEFAPNLVHVREVVLCNVPLPFVVDPMTGTLVRKEKTNQEVDVFTSEVRRALLQQD